MSTSVAILGRAAPGVRQQHHHYHHHRTITTHLQQLIHTRTILSRVFTSSPTNTYYPPKNNYRQYYYSSHNNTTTTTTACIRRTRTRPQPSRQQLQQQQHVSKKKLSCTTKAAAAASAGARAGPAVRTTTTMAAAAAAAATRLELPESIFNEQLYDSIVNLWYGGVSDLSSGVLTEQLQARWFNVGALASPEAQRAFDQECRSRGAAALDFLSPERISIPPAAASALSSALFVSSTSATSGGGGANRNDETETEKVKEEVRALARRVIHAFGSLPIFSPSSSSSSSSSDQEKKKAKAANAALALVLLLDQFPRNLFRGQQRLIYGHYDVLARALMYALALPPASIFPSSSSSSSSTNTPSGSSSSSSSKEAGGDAPAGLLYNLHMHPSIVGAPLKYQFVPLPLMHSESLADHDVFDAVMRQGYDARLKLKSSLSSPSSTSTAATAGAGAAGGAAGAGQGSIKEKEEEENKDDDQWYRAALRFEEEHRALLERFGRYPHRNEHLGRAYTPEEKQFLEKGGARFGT